MAEVSMPNGTPSPQTPKRSSFALTEYTANPSPNSESPQEKARYTIPEAFLLPNGFPDVGRVFLSRTSRV